MTDPITLLYRAFNPSEALEPNDSRVVNCDQARHGGIAGQLAKEFQRADPNRPLHRLFTGHIGVGKSTELLRLKRILESTSLPSRLETIYFDINDHLDPNDLKLADLLVLVASRVQAHLADHKTLKGFKATNVALERFWDHLKQFVNSGVTLSEVEIPAGISNLTVEIKEGAPTQREALRKAINDQRTTLRAGVRDLLETALQAFQQQQLAQGIVIIIDGLEKLPADQHEELFFTGCEQMADLAAHSVYTVPMSLAYHPRFSTLIQAFGHQPVPLPMIHANTEEGLGCLELLISQRCDYAQVSPLGLFDTDATRTTLCRQTGGHLRYLMIFIRTALSKIDSLPITSAALDSALRDTRHALARQIPGNYWPWLRRFRSGALPALPDDLPDDVRRDLLHQLLVYEYVNGEPRYDVNPVIRELHNFTHGEPAPVNPQS